MKNTLRPRKVIYKLTNDGSSIEAIFYLEGRTRSSQSIAYYGETPAIYSNSGNGKQLVFVEWIDKVYHRKKMSLKDATKLIEKEIKTLMVKHIKQFYI